MKMATAVNYIAETGSFMALGYASAHVLQNSDPKTIMVASLIYKILSDLPFLPSSENHPKTRNVTESLWDDAFMSDASFESRFFDFAMFSTIKIFSHSLHTLDANFLAYKGLQGLTSQTLGQSFVVLGFTSLCHTIILQKIFSGKVKTA